MSSKLEDKISQTKKLLDDLKQRQREEERTARAARPKLKPGRKALEPAILAKAEKLADKLPLTEVALRCGVALKTLYNYNLSRKSLNEKKGAANVLNACRM